jgi:hypothetical protein
MAGVDSTAPAPDPGPGSGLRLYSAHNRIFNVIGLVGGAVIAAAVAVIAHSWPVRVPAGLVALGLAAWAVRGGLVGVACTEQAVVLRELSRTRRVRWDDLLEIGVRTDRHFKITSPELRIYGTGRGRRLAAMSLASKRPDVTDRQVATLTEQWHSRVADSTG